MHLAFLILCKSAVSSAHPSKSKPAAVKVIVASWPVGVIPWIVTASPPHNRPASGSATSVQPSSGQYMSEYHEESVMSSTTRSASGEATVPFPLLPSNHLV